MDPIVIAAIVNAAGGVATTMIKKWQGEKTRDNVQVKVDKVMKGQYDNFRKHLSNKCVEILLLTESGNNFRVQDLRQKTFPQLKINSTNTRDALDREFAYRLQFLAALGLLGQSQREYHITRLGASFLRAARDKKDYFDVLFQKEISTAK